MLRSPPGRATRGFPGDMSPRGIIIIVMFKVHLMLKKETLFAMGNIRGNLDVKLNKKIFYRFQTLVEFVVVVGEWGSRCAGEVWAFWGNRVRQGPDLQVRAKGAGVVFNVHRKRFPQVAPIMCP